MLSQCIADNRTAILYNAYFSLKICCTYVESVDVKLITFKFEPTIFEKIPKVDMKDLASFSHKRTATLHGYWIYTIVKPSVSTIWVIFFVLNILTRNIIKYKDEQEVDCL